MKTALYAFASASIIALSATAASAVTTTAVATTNGPLTEPGKLVFTFDKFDPSLGTLNSVTIVSGEITTTGVLTLSNDTSEAVTSSGSIILTISDYSDVDSVGYTTLQPAGDQASGSKSSGNVEIAGNSSQDFNLTKTLTVGQNAFGFDWILSNPTVSNFIGLDTYALEWETAVDFAVASGSAFTATGTASTDGTFVIQYDYTEAPAAVPLPAALPLMGAGLAGLAFVARRRKS